MSTPLRGVHVAVVGDDRDALEFLTQTLRYHGALGNSAHPTTNASEATDAEIRPALDAILADGTVARTETKAFGCTIKR